MIASVIRMHNNMVMVFDEDGQEIPEYQGTYSGVKQMILEQFSADTVFKHWYTANPSPTIVQAGEW